VIMTYAQRYAYRFGGQHVRIVKRALPCGDYAVILDQRLVASVERKSVVDLVASLTSGKLRYAIAELAALPRAAVVIEDRYSQIFKVDRIPPALVADGLAELQIRWPDVPIVFCETRQLAEEWTYRFLAAAHVWAETEHAAIAKLTQPGIADATTKLDRAPVSLEHATAEIRAWARVPGSPSRTAANSDPTCGTPGAAPTKNDERFFGGRVRRGSRTDGGVQRGLLRSWCGWGIGWRSSMHEGNSNSLPGNRGWRLAPLPGLGGQTGR
jgi:hypothetical protein